MFYLIIGFLLAGFAKKTGYLDGLTNVGFIMNFIALVVAWPLFLMNWMFNGF